MPFWRVCPCREQHMRWRSGWPLPIRSLRQAASEPKTPVVPSEKPVISLATDQEHQFLLKQTKDRLGSGRYGRFGALVIFVRKDLVGRYVSIAKELGGWGFTEKSGMTIAQYTINRSSVYAAVFQALEPGIYSISLDLNTADGIVPKNDFRTYVSVQGGTVTEIDWR
jgi:hypothetical protein